MRIRLLDIAHARSGDKGDTANVGVIALEPQWYEVLEQFVTRKRVADHFRGMIEGDVERYELPNLNALNFLLHGALDGGGTLSLKTDAQGKVYSTALLRMVIDELREEIVPGHDSDPKPAFCPALFGRGFDRHCARRWVHAPGVGDDLDAAVQHCRQHALHRSDEIPRVAE